MHLVVCWRHKCSGQEQGEGPMGCMLYVLLCTFSSSKSQQCRLSHIDLKHSAARDVLLHTIACRCAAARHCMPVCCRLWQVTGVLLHAVAYRCAAASRHMVVHCCMPTSVGLMLMLPQTDALMHAAALLVCGSARVGALLPWGINNQLNMIPTRVVA